MTLKINIENGQKNEDSYSGSKILTCYKTSIDFKNNVKWTNEIPALIMIFLWQNLASLGCHSCAVWKQLV